MPSLVALLTLLLPGACQVCLGIGLASGVACTPGSWGSGTSMRGRYPSINVMKTYFFSSLTARTNKLECLSQEYL